MIRIALVFAALAALAVPAFAADKPKAPGSIREGLLTDSKGMTLYTFDKDKDAPGKSACNGPCAENWPPLKASADSKPAGDWTTVNRDDGSKQWAYKGKPVYLWIKDKKPGDKTGDGVKDVWHVVKE